MDSSIEIQIPFRDENEKELIIACFDALGYEAFEENNFSISAYCSQKSWQGLETLRSAEEWLGLEKNSLNPKILEAQNYNASWEAKLQPVFVNQFVQILPVGYPEQNNFKFTLHITPKMSFGTGHHQTTRLMIRMMENCTFQNKSVLDMGSGTGILGILAAKLSAVKVTGIDIEEWCTENAQENALLNQTDTVCKWITGTSEELNNQGMFDLILANINRNILLKDGQNYLEHLEKNGILIISGFYWDDMPVLLKHFHTLNMHIIESLQEDQWIALKLSRNNI